MPKLTPRELKPGMIVYGLPEERILLEINPDEVERLDTRRVVISLNTILYVLEIIDPLASSSGGSNRCPLLYADRADEDDFYSTQDEATYEAIRALKIEREESLGTLQGMLERLKTGLQIILDVRDTEGR
jgi:hypothetical protein